MKLRLFVRVLAVWALGCFVSLGRGWAATPGGGAVIDDCQYATDAAAQAAWQPMRGSAKAAAAVVEGRRALRLPCNFSGNKVERASWDRKVKLDLASSRGIQFQILCRDASPVTYFAIYFQSGEGWYHATFFPERSGGWNTIELEKTELKPEGKPGGWGQIKTIRISAWRGKETNTEFYLRDLRAPPVQPPPGPRELAEAVIARIGKLASFAAYEEATNRISLLAPQEARVREALAQADASRASALKLVAQQRFGEAREQAAAAAEQLQKAFCLAQRPAPGEFRAFWCHSAFGLNGVDWDEAIRRLAENGFTAILPNMLWGGAAFYQSTVLPVAAQVAERGDQIRQCVAACRKYGLQVHVWKVNWNLGSAAPKTFVEKMRREGRLQASSAGKEEPWLCPSHPANQQLEIEAMLEVVRNYDVDGVHFDYIRYPDNDHCFCPGCRERFQRLCGVKLQRWPEDVLADGPLRQQWLDWRRSNITTVVKAVSEQARAVKPKIKISAAVFRYWNTDRDAVGQDWKVWCDKGYVDFVCPMDYTPINSRFENMVSQQVKWAGRTPCYPGLGASASSSRFGVDRAIEQINLTRQYQTHGFVIFNYGVSESTNLLPMLGLGATRKE
jgi:uncharacterized lipoprotein YddW (UPF0748 family)